MDYCVSSAGNSRLKERDRTEPRRGGPIVAVGSTHGKDCHKTRSEDPGGVQKCSDGVIAMSTCTQIFYHIVFSTKGREATLLATQDGKPCSDMSGRENGGPLRGPVSSTLSVPRVCTRGYYREVPSGLPKRLLLLPTLVSESIGLLSTGHRGSSCADRIPEDTSAGLMH
jgi:hypothetical protein